MDIIVDRNCIEGQSSNLKYPETPSFGLSAGWPPPWQSGWPYFRGDFFTSKALIVRFCEDSVGRDERPKWWSSRLFSRGKTASHQAEPLQSCQHFCHLDEQHNCDREMNASLTMSLSIAGIYCYPPIWLYVIDSIGLSVFDWLSPMRMNTGATTGSVVNVWVWCDHNESFFLQLLKKG
jgi:hypothetical protein